MNRVLPSNSIEPKLPTISDAIELQAALRPDSPAIVCTGLPALTFGELDRAIKQIGNDLRTAGIGSASRVAVLLPNGPEAAIVSIAVSSHAICFPLASALTAAEFASEVRRVDLDAVIFPSWTNLPSTDAARASAIGIFRTSKAKSSLADTRLESVVDIRAERRRSGVPSARSVAVIQTSSGSTGIPKHVLVTHANLFDVAGKMRTWYGISENDRSACILPIHAALGFKLLLLAPLLIGSSVALPNKQQAEHIAEWCRDLNPTWFFAAPVYLNAALDKLRSLTDGKVKHSLRFFVTSGTHFSERVAAGLEEILGIPGLEQYGMREAGPISANHAPPAERKPGTVGRIDTDVAILDSDGAILPHGMSGAVVVRGQGISPGYIDALPAGSDTVPNGRSPDQWLLTGDLGIVDADGFLSIIGRTKQIINRGGEKIAPSEIEKALLLHPAVREAVVFGVPHPRLGESIAAAVVREPETEVTSAELQSFLYERVSLSKIPQRVYVVAEFPRTQTGKIQISELKERILNRDRQILRPESSLEALVVEIWERLLGRTDIGIDDNFFELGGDSLLATTMLLEFEALTRRPISPSALQAIWTVRQLAEAVLRDDPTDSELITCAKTGRGEPFFFCHGDYRDRGIYALRLANLIEQDFPIFLLNHYQFFVKSREGSLEDMARLYVPHLLACQPSGRFRIGGYCSGGLLAWAIAHQLRAAGREVEFVILIDSPSLNGRPALRATKTALSLIARLSPKVIRKKIERNGMAAAWVAVRSRPIIWGAIRKLLSVVATSRSSRDKFLLATRDEYRRLSNYIPRKLDTELIWLLSDDNAMRMDFRPSNWRSLASSVHVKVIPGDHLSCVQAFAGVVATELQKIVTAREPERFDLGRPHAEWNRRVHRAANDA
jgi:acyl-CoA synthetase (AMP-forming)/AMP-acid ligase II/thioesterase domain-containing protein/acyl carrier protein